MGGRSRVAAQMLSEEGFNEVYNLSGGFSGWSGEAAFGGEEMGISLFTGSETPEETLVTAYSLEEGLRGFYLLMEEKVNNEEAKKLFHQLSGIEIKHQDRIFEEYIEITGEKLERSEFEKKIVSEAMEGGMTTEEYVNHFTPAPESLSNIVEIAMSIEAQALDLYSRAAARSEAPENKQVLNRIADEERTHLALLGELMDKIHSEGS